MANEVFLIDQKEPTFCGQMMTSFINEYSFLLHDEDQSKVRLVPEVSHEVGVYLDAKLTFIMVDNPDLSFSVSIEVTILRCIVNTA